MNGKFLERNYQITEEFNSITIDTVYSNVAVLPSNDLTCKVVCYEKKRKPLLIKVNNGILEIVHSKKWYNHLGINLREPKITIYLPKKEYGDINIKSVTGKTSLVDIRCANIKIIGTTGKINLKGAIAKEKIFIKRVTGAVNFEKCDANELFVKVKTGKVTGTLLSNKNFIVKSTTGKIEVPQCNSCQKCEITTLTGKIKIAIDENV